MCQAPTLVSDSKVDAVQLASFSYIHWHIINMGSPVFVMIWSSKSELLIAGISMIFQMKPWATRTPFLCKHSGRQWLLQQKYGPLPDDGSTYGNAWHGWAAHANAWHGNAWNGARLAADFGGRNPGRIRGGEGGEEPGRIGQKRERKFQFWVMIVFSLKGPRKEVDKNGMQLAIMNNGSGATTSEGKARSNLWMQPVRLAQQKTVTGGRAGYRKRESQCQVSFSQRDMGPYHKPPKNHVHICIFIIYFWLYTSNGMPRWSKICKYLCGSSRGVSIGGYWKMDYNGYAYICPCILRETAPLCRSSCWVRKKQHINHSIKSSLDVAINPKKNRNNNVTHHQTIAPSGGVPQHFAP